MALGFDSIVAEAIIELKKEGFNTNFIACIPFEGQANFWSDEAKKKYEEYLQYTDSSIILYKRYTKSCMFERNKFMIDNADILIVFTDSFEGGTGQAIKLAKNKGIKVYAISPNKIIEKVNNR